MKNALTIWAGGGWKPDDGRRRLDAQRMLVTWPPRVALSLLTFLSLCKALQGFANLCKHFFKNPFLRDAALGPVFHLNPSTLNLKPYSFASLCQPWGSVALSQSEPSAWDSNRNQTEFDRKMMNLEHTAHGDSRPTIPAFAPLFLCCSKLMLIRVLSC